MFFSTALVALLAGTQFVAGHGVITAAKGDAGGSGSAIGVDPSTPRDGTTAKPFEQDTTRFKGNAADTCGSTKEGGVNDIESGTAAVLKQSGGQLPQITAGGSVQMTLHQVNSDGAGPYACMIDSTGTGTNWQNIQVTTNVAGNDKGRNPDGQAQDHDLAVAIPQDQTCTGTIAGQANVCMVRCQNPANAGPFGGCVPVQMAGNTAKAAGTTSATGNATTTADTTTAGLTTDTETDGADEEEEKLANRAAVPANVSKRDLAHSAKFRRALE